MKLIKSKVLFDGAEEKENMIIGFEGDEIKYVGSRKPDEDRGTEIILEGDDIVVTPAFIDSHSHIGMVRSGEPDKEEESNEQMNSVYPLVTALHSIYMDDPSFTESVESGVLYSTVLPGSGNIIGGKAVLIRNFVQDIGQAYIMDIGIRAANEYVKTALPVAVMYHITFNKLVSYAIESATSRYHIIVTKLAIVFLSSLLPFLHKFT